MGELGGVEKATPPASTTMCPSSSRVEPSSLRRLKAYCPSRSVRSQPLHSTLNSCCGNDAEAAVMKSRLIRRSTRTTTGLSQFLLGENFTVIPRCGQTQRIGTRRIGTRRIRVRYRMFAPRPHLSREEVGSRDGSPRGPGWPVAGGRRLSTAGAARRSAAGGGDSLRSDRRAPPAPDDRDHP